MNTWNFPGGYGLMPKGANEAGIEAFLDDIPMSLAREVIQNSMDAHDPDNPNPVRVVFSVSEEETNKIIGKVDLLERVLPKAINFWQEKNAGDTHKYLKEFKDVFQERYMKVLKISDYNTIGLRKANFDSLIEGSGYSEKADTSASGSKGIGKAAPFAASKLRMVLYNSLATEKGDMDPTEKFAGAINFVSYADDSVDEYMNEYGKEFITQSRGLLENSHYTECEFIKERTEHGTDLYILGLKNIEFWEEQIVLAVLNNFLVSLHNGLLEVEIGKYKIQKDTLNNLFTSIYEVMRVGGFKLKGKYKYEFLKSYSYFNTLTSENHQIIQLPNEWVEKYSFIDSTDDGQLILYKDDEDATRCVLQTRRSGMKIFEQNRISGSIPFTGVFMATGNQINEFLRKLENANHDKWSLDRASDEERNVTAEFLLDLKHWYKSSVEEFFGTQSDESINAFGLNDLLPVVGKEEENEQRTEGGINRRVKAVKKGQISSKSTRVDGDSDEKMIDKLAAEMEIGQGNTSGGGSSKTGASGGAKGDAIYGTGGEPGDKGEEPGGEKVIGHTYREIDSPKFLKLKVMELNSKNGEYRFIALSSIPKNTLAFEWKIVGENGSPYKTDIEVCTSSTHQILKDKRKIIVRNIKKNERIQVDFKVNTRGRVKMKGIIYEVKG